MNTAWEALNCRLKWAYEGLVPQAGNGRQGVASCFFAWLLVHGELEMSFNAAEKVFLSAGEWGFPPPNATGRVQHFSPGSWLLSICFSMNWPDGRAPLQLDRFKAFPRERHPALEREAKALVKLAKGRLDLPLRNWKPASLDFVTYSSLQESFWRWLGAFAKAMELEGASFTSPEELEPRVARMLEILRNVAKHGPVPYERLSAASSLGKVQIDRLFKETLGVSPKQALDRSLAALCRERTFSSSLTVKELADEFGFGDASNFCAWFERMNGASPAELRERRGV